MEKFPYGTEIRTEGIYTYITLPLNRDRITKIDRLLSNRVPNKEIKPVSSGKH